MRRRIKTKTRGMMGRSSRGQQVGARLETYDDDDDDDDEDEDKAEEEEANEVFIGRGVAGEVEAWWRTL